MQNIFVSNFIELIRVFLIGNNTWSVRGCRRVVIYQIGGVLGISTGGQCYRQRVSRFAGKGGQCESNESKTYESNTHESNTHESNTHESNTHESNTPQ
jgi:hypothetical protein